MYIVPPKEIKKNEIKIFSYRKYVYNVESNRRRDRRSLERNLAVQRTFHGLHNPYHKLYSQPVRAESMCLIFFKINNNKLIIFVFNQIIAKFNININININTGVFLHRNSLFIEMLHSMA